MKALLQDASGDEAVDLSEKLRAAEQAAEQAKQNSGLKIMQCVSRRWKNTEVSRALTSWKIGCATSRQTDCLSRDRAEEFSVESAGVGAQARVEALESELAESKQAMASKDKAMAGLESRL